VAVNATKYTLREDVSDVSENNSSLPPPLSSFFLGTVRYSFAFFLIAAAEPLSKVAFVVVVVPMATLAVVGEPAPVEDLLYPAC